MAGSDAEAKAAAGEVTERIERAMAYAGERREAFEEELFELLRIPSVSAQPKHREDTRRAAEFVRDKLTAAGVPAELVETAGHPLVYGERLDAPGRPTLLIYGHYDVQPPEPLELWHSPPFEPTVRDGNVYARGATDDKGQMYTHIKAIEAWTRAAGGLPVNVKVLVEGEEEVGGAGLERYVATHRERLACDYAVISDTSQYAPGIPAIAYGLRGLAYFEIKLRGPDRDLHSGTYGGSLNNPANALVELLATFKGPDGRIRIDGFYDDVVPLADWERSEFAALPFDEAAFKKSIGISETFGEAGYTTLERQWARPTFDVNGIFGGYAGDGPKTVIPSWAGAKFSFRLVPNQDPARIEAALREHVRRHAPPGIEVTLVNHSGGPASVVDVRTPGVRAATRAIERAFGVRPVFIKCGGSIPVVGLLKANLGVDTLLLGWGQDDDNLHAPDEKFSLRDFHRGIAAAAALLGELAIESGSGAGSGSGSNSEAG